MPHRITEAKLTFFNLPLRQPEYWAWGRRDIYTIGLVELLTESGLRGYGEVNLAMGPNDRVIRAIFEQMTPFYIGESPSDCNLAAARIRGTGWYSYQRTAGLVISGLEMACWDLIGKIAGLPVCDLLGGPVRQDFASMYFVPGSDNVEEMVERAADGCKRGFNTIYYKVGADEERDTALVIKTRERIGSAPRLRIDANESWTAGTAVRILRNMARAQLEYIEQPTLMHDIDGLKHVRDASGVQVAANQASWGSYAILDIIRRGAADVIMTDMQQEGGVWALKRILGICEAAAMPFVLHAFSCSSFFIKAQLHILSTSPMGFLAQQGHPDYFSDDYIVSPLTYENGRIAFDRKPGWGVEVDDAKVAKFHKKYLEEGSATSYTNSRQHQVVTVPAR